MWNTLWWMVWWRCETEDVIDGSGQNFEANIADDPEWEGFVLRVNGTHTDFRIPINYCPFCGEKL